MYIHMPAHKYTNQCQCLPCHERVRESESESERERERDKVVICVNIFSSNVFINVSELPS